MVLYQSTISRGERFRSIMEFSAIATFARRQECLDKKYMSHISGICFVKISNLYSIKEVLLGSLYNRKVDAKQYKKYEHKWKKDMKAPNKQNKMIYGIAKKSRSRHELKKNKKFKSKDFKKCSCSSSDYSSSGSNSDSLISSYSD